MNKESPMIKTLEELFSKIKQDLEKEKTITSLYIAKDSKDSMLEELLVQPMYRSINNKEIKFLGIRNIIIKKEFRGEKLFTQFVNQIETLKIPILIHDIINQKLMSYFANKGYETLKERKYYQETVSMYFLNNKMK